MPGDDMGIYYDNATQRWPRVGWSRAAYIKHLGDDSPAHPIDLYLSGAAGHRIDAAWQSIDADLGPDARRILQRQPTADYIMEDLWSDTLVRLMDNDAQQPVLDDGRQPARIIRYRGKVKLLHYFVVVAKRLAIQRQRKRRPTLHLVAEHDESTVQHADPKSASPDVDLQEQETAEAMQHALSQAYARLSAEQQFLIAMVYRQGMKQKAAGTMLGWSEFKASRQLKAAMQILRQALVTLAHVDWTPQLAAAWEGCLTRCWEDNLSGAGGNRGEPGGEGPGAGGPGGRGSARVG